MSTAALDGLQHRYLGSSDIISVGRSCRQRTKSILDLVRQFTLSALDDAHLSSCPHRNRCQQPDGQYHQISDRILHSPNVLLLNYDLLAVDNKQSLCGLNNLAPLQVVDLRITNDKLLITNCL